MVPRYIYENPEWPSYRWDGDAIAPQLAAIHFKRGVLLASMVALGFQASQEAMLSVIVQDVQKSSAIEGEHLDAVQIRSSVARRLGVPEAGVVHSERGVEGVVDMTLDATQKFDQPLDAERLYAWHAALFPAGRSGLRKITVGAWRQAPMQVLGGVVLGREKVHYEAPAAENISSEMQSFLSWFENARVDPIVRAALAHLWFETIHPFDDGNGRIGRAIMDLALARADGTSQRFYSMSAQIQQSKNGYYEILEHTQKGSMDVTQWIQWFLARLSDALAEADTALAAVRRRQAFWHTFGDAGLNERQRKIVEMLLAGFHGKLRREKYAKITSTSDSTAFRDLTELVEKGVLRIGEGGGRSTHYELAWQETVSSLATTSRTLQN